MWVNMPVSMREAIWAGGGEIMEFNNTLLLLCMHVCIFVCKKWHIALSPSPIYTLTRLYRSRLPEGDGVSHDRWTRRKPGRLVWVPLVTLTAWLSLLPTAATPGHRKTGNPDTSPNHAMTQKTGSGMTKLTLIIKKMDFAHTLQVAECGNMVKMVKLFITLKVMFNLRLLLLLPLLFAGRHGRGAWNGLEGERCL